MGLMEMATSLLSGINPQAAQKARSEYGKYTSDIDGLRQCVADWGGQAMVDKALEFVDRSPRVKAALSQAGIDPKAIAKQVGTSPTPNAPKSTQQSNNYKDRLAKLK